MVSEVTYIDPNVPDITVRDISMLLFTDSGRLFSVVVCFVSPTKHYIRYVCQLCDPGGHGRLCRMDLDTCVTAYCTTHTC